MKLVGEAFLITLREGFEAALIVAIILAAVRTQGRLELSRWIWLGTAGALLLAAIVGWILHITIDDLTGVARQRTFAIICLAAAGLLTWMIFWMRRHARSLRSELQHQVEAALGHSALALAGVAFLAVAREGLETALFLISTTSADDGSRIVIGGLLGLAVATVLGVAVYHGSRVIPMKAFFQVSGVLIIMFAAGLLSRAVQFLQAAGDLGTADNAVYDLTGFHWLTIDSEAGRFLAGIFGWDPRPSMEQVLVYLLFLVPVLVAFFWKPKARPVESPARAPPGPPRSDRSTRDAVPRVEERRSRVAEHDGLGAGAVRQADDQPPGHPGQPAHRPYLVDALDTALAHPGAQHLEPHRVAGGGQGHQATRWRGSRKAMRARPRTMPWAIDPSGRRSATRHPRPRIPSCTSSSTRSTTASTRPAPSTSKATFSPTAGALSGTPPRSARSRRGAR